MATRSTIALRLEDGTIKQIYCHWDGYPSHNGRLLVENYNTPEKIDELLNLGDLSSLRENIKPNDGELHDFENPQSNVCVAYGRDRGEMNVNFKIFKKSESRQKEEYNYLFENGKWFFSEDDGKLRELKEEHFED